MRLLQVSVALVLSLGSVASGQSPSEQEFEVASVRANHSGHNAIGGRGICGSAGRVSVTNIPLSLVLEQAYDVKEFQLVGRPSWLTSERFDIEAKPASPAGYDRCKLMVQALLADRFGLAIHRESRLLPIYRLVVVKSGAKLHGVDAGAPLGIKTFSTTTGELTTRGTSMPQLARMLASTGELENLVVDATGLEGYFEFALEWNTQ